MKRIEMAVLVAVLALLAACGGRAPAAATATPQKGAATAQPQEVSPTEPAESATAAVVAQLTEPATPGATNDEADLQLADEETALKNLKSYKTTWSFEWTGKKQDGTQQTVKWLTAESYTTSPQASYTKFESSDTSNPGQAGWMEFYQVGGKTYMVTQQDGKTACTAMSSGEDKPSPSMLSRGAFGSISSGKLIGPETVNGVAAKHYKYDEKSTGVNYFSKLSGDVWVAEDGGYVVKDVAEWEGSLFGMLAGGSTSDVGKGSWKQEVTDINQPFEITAPEGCENAAEGLPMLKDATEQMSIGAITTYKSAAKLAEAVEFYKAEMPKAGWKAEGDPTIADTFASLVFSKDGKKASITVTGEDTGVTVMVQVE